MSGTEWAALLDGFEAELAGDDRDAPAWHPLAAPLPTELLPRARDILARQNARMAALRTDLAQVRAHLDAVERIPAPRESAAAYLDVDG